MVYIKTNKLSITHEDQEVDGLRFQVLVSKDGYDYVQVEGSDTKVSTWKTRVEGTYSSLDEVNTIIASLPKPEEVVIQDTVTGLETQLAQTNADIQELMISLVNKGILA